MSLLHMCRSQVSEILSSNALAENRVQSLHKCWNLNIKLKKPIFIVIFINLFDWMIVDRLVIWFYPLLLLDFSRVSQQFCRALWDDSLSLLNIWCYEHFMMEKITCYGLGNGSILYLVLSTVSLFPIHQSRYLILRNSSAVFYPFHASYRNTFLWSSMCILV